MQTLRLLIHSRSVNLSVGFLLAAIWVLFAMRHVEAFQETGKLAFLIFCVSESLQALFFVARKHPETVSLDIFDWLVGVGGSLLPLLVVPGGIVVWEYGQSLVALGVLLQIAGLLSLNRSFAIVAARREIKTRGMYRLIRHPMYASYLLLFTGYLLFNASWFNAGLLGLSLVFLFFRIKGEEKHLGDNEEYRAYSERVRYRLIPFVY